MAVTAKRGRPRFSDGDQAVEQFRALAMQTLERADGVPRWIQLKNCIEEAILSGSLPPQSQIPPEQALCEIFEASKPVIRAAFSALAAEGRIIKMPRKGMFVANVRSRPPETDFITSNLSVFGDMSARGYRVSAKTFDFRRDLPSEAEQRIFGIPENGSVIRIGRVYYSDDQPLTLTNIVLPGHRVPGMEKLDLENRSIFGTLKEQYGLTARKAERWFTAEIPPDEVLERMGLPKGHPLIAIESIAYDHEGMPLEYYRGYYNSAIARIHIRIGES